MSAILQGRPYDADTDWLRRCREVLLVSASEPRDPDPDRVLVVMQVEGARAVMASMSERDYETLRAEAETRGRSVADFVGEELALYAAQLRRRRVLARVQARVDEEIRRDGPIEPGRALREYEEAVASSAADEDIEPTGVEDLQA